MFFQTGIISPPPISARGPLPPLQRVPLPVPSSNKPESIPKSYPESLSSIHNDANDIIKINNVNNDNPLNPDDSELLNRNSSTTQSSNSHDEPDESKSFKDFEATSLCSVEIVNSPQHSSNRVSKINQCKIRCLSALSTKNTDVEVLSAVSDGDDVIYVMNCNKFLNSIAHQNSCEINKNVKNTTLKLWLEGIDDRTSCSTGSFRDNKFKENQGHSAQNNHEISDEEFNNNLTFTIKLNSDDENNTDSDGLTTGKSEDDSPSNIRDERFHHKCVREIKDNLLNSKDICNNSVMKDSLSFSTAAQLNLPNQCGDSIKSMPNFYKYPPPKKILNMFSEHDKTTCTKTYYSPSRIDVMSDREHGTTEEEEIINVINEKNSTASSRKFSNRTIERTFRNSSRDNMGQPQDDLNNRIKSNDKTILIGVEKSDMCSKRHNNSERKLENNHFKKLKGKVLEENMSKKCLKSDLKISNCVVESDCLNKTIDKYFKTIEILNSKINVHDEQDLNGRHSLSRKISNKDKKSVQSVKSNCLLNCNKSTVDNVVDKNEYLMVRNRNSKPKNGVILNLFSANNNYEDEVLLKMSEKKENNVCKKDYVKKNVWSGERLRGGEDIGYEEIKGVWRRIDVGNNPWNSESSQLVIKHTVSYLSYVS